LSTAAYGADAAEPRNISGGIRLQLFGEIRSQDTRSIGARFLAAVFFALAAGPEEIRADTLPPIFCSAKQKSGLPLM
jgi:hypothetical protein